MRPVGDQEAEGGREGAGGGHAHGSVAAAGGHHERALERRPVLHQRADQLRQRQRALSADRALAEAPLLRARPPHPRRSANSHDAIH
jgi:hypothetical protein